MSLFRHQVYLAVILGHMTTDIFSSMGPVLVTFFSVPMALSAAQIGLAIGTFQLISAGSQPLFGWLADKIGSRWLGPGSVVWTLIFLSISVLFFQKSNNFYLFMIPFGIAGLGVGAFHPQGVMHAGTSNLHRAATATAVFFLFGQVGLASGPALGGLILDHIGVSGIYLLAVLLMPLPLFMVYAMRHVTAEANLLPETTSSTSPNVVSNPDGVRWAAIGLLAMLITLRSWAFLGTVAFLPKIFQNMGWDATSYGFITGTYWLASGIAGVLAGGLADRWGRRQVVFVTLLTGSMVLYFIPLNSGWGAFPLAIMAGGLLGASHSILVVIAQSLLPGRKALASGLTLGYIFGVGAVAVWSIGVLADIWTLISVIQAGAGIGTLAALLALLLPTTRTASQPQAGHVTA
jgi:FSR family fosmidomycin resistance protein-like MFS transporter